MGEEAALLLVRRGKSAVLAMLALLPACGGNETRGPSGQVDPGNHDAFFLWAGVRPPAVLDRAKTIYILAGEVRIADGDHVIPLRPVVPRVRHADLWLVLRLERLDGGERVADWLLRELVRWEAGGGRIAGVQIDFDAGTKGLEGYGAFLRDLRRRLPPRYALSVTGLLDWSANGDPAALAGLGGVVDEVVIQTYQGKRTIPGYEDYMRSLRRLPLPFKVGLVERGEWREPAGLRQDPQFRGYVVFLLSGK